jgi:hypothetical protein
MCMAVRTWSKKLIIVVSVQMMNLQEPHEMHCVHGPRKSAISLMDITTDRLGARDSLVADLDSSVMPLSVGNQIWHRSRRSRNGILPRHRREYCIDCNVHTWKNGGQ